MTLQPTGHPRLKAASGKRSERMLAILDLVAERGTISLSDLADALNVSAATARRDLADLEAQRLLLRTHGGAAVIESRPELPVTLRDSKFQEAKRAIAAHVAGLIPNGGRHAVALCGGSTTSAVAHALSTHRELTIVTNSLTIAGLITTYPQLSVVMTGGTLRAESLELVGVIAERTFNAMNVGTAVLGADGITASGGVTTHNETEARTNNAMLMHAQYTIVVADGSKLGRLALAEVAPITAVNLLVTDSSADATVVEEIRAAGVEVHVLDV
ncbi:MAG: DeoR/GlpR family DNA-binding transcription regulator [Mycetocola sp.]